MAEQKHTKEPWEMSAEHKGRNQYIICGPESPRADYVVGLVYGRDEEEHIANGQRIVACVNALAGISDPSAVGELIKAVEGAMRIKELWLPWEDKTPPEHEEEAKALCAMADSFASILSRLKVTP